MFFAISAYFHFTLVLGTIYIFFISINVGLAYFIATLPLLFFTSKFVKLPKEYVPFILIAAGSIWVFYLVRPLLLVVRPGMFNYPRIGYINNTDHIHALLQIAVYSFLFLSGLYWAVKRGANKRRNPSPFFNNSRAGLLLKNKQIIIMMLGIIVLFDMLLLFRYNIGVSGTYSPVAFIRLFLPLELVMPIFVLYLIKYRCHLTLIEQIWIFSVIVFVVLISLFQGHKAALLSVIMITVLFYLLEKGNFKISLTKMLFLGTAVLIIIFITFPMAMAIRSYMQWHGFSIETFNIILESLSNMTDEIFLLTGLNLVTSRFSGYDGLLVVNIYKPPELDSIFNELYILKRVVASLVPKFSLEGISPGKAVGMFYTGHSLDIRHAGALGLFASIILIGKGTLSYFFILFIGIFFGMCFRFAMKFESFDSRMLLSYIFSHQLMRWMISGNLDGLISSFIIILVHLTFYFSIFWFMYKACKQEKILAL